MAGVLRRWRFQPVLCRCSCSGSRVPVVSERPLILCNPASRRMSSEADREARRSGAVRQQLEAAAREDRLDFFKAAKILFSTPAKPREFGFLVRGDIAQARLSPLAVLRGSTSSICCVSNCPVCTL